MGKHFNFVKTVASKAFLIMAMIATFTFSAHAVKSDARRADLNSKFIIGIFSVNPTRAFTELKNAGFNCVHTYEKKQDYLSQYVRDAERLDLFAIIYTGGLYKKHGGLYEKLSDSEKEDVINFVSKNELPNVIWYLADEPDLKIDPDARQKISTLNSVVKSAAPDATTALTAGWRTNYQDWADIADVFMVDIYPIGKAGYNDNIQKVSEHTRKAIKAVNGKKPVWLILQAFGYQNKKNKAWGWKREPTYDEARAMTYLAIINGAKGVFYYTYHGSQYFIEDSKQNWSNIKSIVAELNSYLPVLTAEASDQIVVDDLSGNNAIEYSVKKYKGKYYLFAVNGTRENVKARIRGRAGVIDEKFKPLETRIYVFD